MTTSLITSAILFFSLSTHASPAVQSVAKKDINSFSQISHDIILEGDNYWILKTPEMGLQNDHFYLKFPIKKQDLVWLREKADIIDVRMGEHAIVTFNNEQDQLFVSEKLHELTGQCGSLRWLSPESIGIGLPAKGPLVNEKSEEVATWIQQASLSNITAGITSLVQLGSRYHTHSTGVNTGDFVAQMYRDRLPAHRTDVTIDTFSHKKSKQKSVIVRILGQERPDEVIVLGSHLDSTSGYFGGNTSAPGADDNASGTATNLEVFELMMNQHIYPRRTIEIHAYAAEEVGLFGSAEIAQNYKNNSVNVLSMVQFDMNGYSPQSGGNIFLVTNETHPVVTDDLARYIDFYLSRKWTKKALTAGSSDHASWTKAGYPAAFPTENTTDYNKKIHTTEDTLNNINDPDKMRIFAQLGLAYLVHYAGFIEASP